MTIAFGNRLVELRKKAGLSQEAVADKLGISRQAVSRWETGEASPDTDNLVALADLYGCSLDELVRQSKTDEVTPAEVVEQAHPKRDPDDDGPHATSRRIGYAMSLMSTAALIAYLLCGFLWKTENGGAIGWASMWILFLVPPFFRSVLAAIHHRRWTKVAIPLLVVIVYVGMGIIGGFYGQNFWHPYWIEFLFIPVYYSLAGFIDGRQA